MAKCTITIEDGDDGETKVGVKFDPAVETRGDMTEAQQIGWALAEKMAKATT